MSKAIYYNIVNFAALGLFDVLKKYPAYKKIFEYVSTSTSSGSAASVISASRSGEGALYQAIFWPDKDSGFVDANGETIYVEWTGEVHSFLVDDSGNLREDTCGNGKLDLAGNEDTDGD